MSTIYELRWVMRRIALGVAAGAPKSLQTRAEDQYQKVLKKLCEENQITWKEIIGLGDSYELTPEAEKLFVELKQWLEELTREKPNS